jgi:predicted HAD superfamily Cof-like phosphohydrolase
MEVKNQSRNLLQKISSVHEFHEVFRIGSNHNPCTVEENDYLLRHRLMSEENEEYLDACRRGDITDIADALGDKLYILFGTILKHGLQYKIEEIFDEIHRSNMSKLDENGQPIFREDGKILKSNLYFKPDIRKILAVEEADQ